MRVLKLALSKLLLLPAAARAAEEAALSLKEVARGFMAVVATKVRNGDVLSCVGDGPVDGVASARNEVACVVLVVVHVKCVVVEVWQVLAGPLGPLLCGRQ